MAKRRSVMAGLGALATGSGAVFASGAFDSAIADSGADLRVIADAQLRVRSARNSDGDPIEGGVTGAENTYYDNTDFSDEEYDSWFEANVEDLIDKRGKRSVGAVQINEGQNNGLAIRTAFSTRLDGEVTPLIEISNNTETSYEVGINYAADSGEDDGYGGAVGGDGLSKEFVKAIYQFKLDDTSSGEGTEINKVATDSSLEDGDLLSPTPDTETPSDEIDDANKVELGEGETIFVKLDYNTDHDSEHGLGNLVGEINSAAGGNIDNINPNLDLLNTIYVTADDAS